MSATDTRVRQIVIEQLGVTAETVTAQADLIEDLGADSLDRIELMMACEEEFGIAIDDPEAEQCRTVADVTALIIIKVAARQASGVA
jgi:acyl carrier protein